MKTSISATQLSKENGMFGQKTDDGLKPLGAIGRSSSSAASLTSLCTDISPSSSHFFEVLYIGKVRVSNRKITEAFIDTALIRFRHNELSKHIKTNGYLELRRPSSHDVGSKFSDASLNGTNTLSVSSENTTNDHRFLIGAPTERSRANSIASLSTLKNDLNGGNDDMKQNRTMLFHVGRNDLRLVSPDRKEILLHKQLKDVVNCVQGIDEPDHFGVICRDPNSSSVFLGYVFKCESDSVVGEIIGAIKQSYAVDNKYKSKVSVMNCERCPMEWFRKLAAEIDGLPDQEIQNTILRKIEELPEDEQEMVLNKLNATASVNTMDDNCAEQNQLMLTLLKAHCEGKQSRHVHDTVENRHEFLHHYLSRGTIFSKAKRSLTSSFDQLLKRKASKDDFSVLAKELSLPPKTTISKEPSIQSSSSSSDLTDENRIKNAVTIITVPPSSNREILEDSPTSNKSTSPHRVLNSPKSMREIFLKVGSSPRYSVTPLEQDMDLSDEGTGSWRHNIFKNVITPNKHVRTKETPKKTKTKAELRALWKKAINQQILLIRMEKENAKLYARQEEATMKRIKLEYDDISPFAKENTEVWEVIINKADRKYDEQMLLQAVKRGIPRSKRGEVWQFLAEQYCSKLQTPIDATKFPKYDIPYDQLLKELTSQQHAILIDLGRTFPNHSYFMSPLGPGQLALYNLLKAYSLLDEEVAYCQGLSFIAGILLLHMSEEEAFGMLRHLMFRRNLRQQYLPDMAGLQVQLYQLTRLLKDHLPQLFEHFDKHEISPILYAAPWILTIFASQFPLGFVVRVFDLIFVEGSGILFKVILALLSYHKDNLLMCDGFEQIMDYLKITVPIINKNILDNIIKSASMMDISKQLLEYSVEYNVLHEELSTPRPEIKKLKQIEEINRALREKNQSLLEQLEIALSNNSRSETVRVKHLSQINKLESEVRALEVTVNTLAEFISSLAYGRSDVEIPNDVLRILSQLKLAERRRSLSKPSLTDLTGNGNESVKDKQITLGQLKSNSLTPKQSSSYFSKSFDQIRQQKLAGLMPNETTNNKLLQEITAECNGLTKSLSDARNLKFDKILEEGTDRSQSLGRQSTSHDMQTLKLFQKNYSKEIQKPATCPVKPLLKTSQSSFELGSGTESIESLNEHPLNCGGVQISFSGATKLKSLRAPRMKSEMQLNVPKNLIEKNETNFVSCEDDENANSSKNSISNDSAFDESIESVDLNNINLEKGESTISSVKDSKLNNSDITIS